MTTVDIDQIIAKYTDDGHGTDSRAAGHITEQAIAAAHRSADPTYRTLALALEQAAYAIVAVEAELAQVARWIGESLNTIHANLTAAAGQHAPTLNPIGELQAHAPRIDALIAVRHTRIGHMQTLARIWRAGQSARDTVA